MDSSTRNARDAENTACHMLRGYRPALLEALVDIWQLEATRLRRATETEPGMRPKSKDDMALYCASRPMQTGCNSAGMGGSEAHRAICRKRFAPRVDYRSATYCVAWRSRETGQVMRTCSIASREEASRVARDLDRRAPAIAHWVERGGA